MDKQGNSGFSLEKVALETKQTVSLFAEKQDFEELAVNFVLYQGSKN